MASYFVIRVPGVVPPNIQSILEKALLSRAIVTAPQAEAQVWSGPGLDARWGRGWSRTMEVSKNDRL